MAISNRDYITFVSGKQKRSPSDADEPLFLGVGIGATGSALNITESGSNMFDFNSKRLEAVADPTAAQHAATKNYVDTQISANLQGLDVKESARIGSDADGNWTGTASANYVVGTGVLTLTDLAAGSSLGLLDGVEPVATNRILLKDMASISALTTDGGGEATPGKYNGLWEVTGGTTTTLTLTRAVDADESAEITANLFCFVEEGTSNADTGWTITTNDPITVNVTNIVFAQFSGAGSISAGAGLSKSGSVINVGDVNKGVQANADDLEIDGSEIASTGIEQDATNSWQVRLAAQGNGIAGGAGSTLSVASDSTGGANLATVVNVSANGVAMRIDDSTIGENGSNQLFVKNAGITETQLATSVAGDGLAGGAGTALSVNVGDGMKILSDAVARNDSKSLQNDNASPITIRQAVIIEADGNVDLASKANASNDVSVGIVEDASISAAASGNIYVRRGAIIPGFSGLTPGDKVYVGATAGSITQDISAYAAGEFAHRIGRALSATEIEFDPEFEIEL